MREGGIASATSTNLSGPAAAKSGCGTHWFARSRGERKLGRTGHFSHASAADDRRRTASVKPRHNHMDTASRQILAGPERRAHKASQAQAPPREPRCAVAGRQARPTVRIPALKGRIDAVHRQWLRARDLTAAQDSKGLATDLANGPGDGSLNQLQLVVVGAGGGRRRTPSTADGRIDSDAQNLGSFHDI